MKYLFILSLTISNFVFASDYCLMDKNESKCGYSSINDCQNDSKNKGGMCIPSQVFSNDSKYCLVTNLGRNCVYNNFETCQKSAESINGSCQLK